MMHQKNNIAPNSYSYPKMSGLLILIVLVCSANAQELEPRMLTNVPLKTNFVGFGYVYTQGNYLLDPSIPIENLEAKLNTAIGAYVRSFNFFGKSAKFDFVLPYAYGNWAGNFQGIDTTTSRLGLGDLRFRVSVNLIGAPALKMQDYKYYQQKTILGVSLQVFCPLGTYYSDKIINLGSNRWTFKPQLGLSHKAGKWHYEVYLSTWLFTDNVNYFNGNRLRQNPMFTTKVHIIRSFPRRIWAALDVGYAIGGKTKLNETQREDRISSIRLGTTIGLPINMQHTLKLALYTGIRFERGPDFSAAALVYQYRWSKKEKPKKEIE